jgi:hypothetical protein
MKNIYGSFYENKLDFESSSSSDDDTNLMQKGKILTNSQKRLFRINHINKVNKEKITLNLGKTASKESSLMREKAVKLEGISPLPREYDIHINK